MLWSESGYPVVPPATSSCPLGRNAWPAQNMSYGVGIDRNVFVTGFHSVVVNVPAAKRFGSLPDPWIRRT